MAVPNINVGILGHIDSGKTSLCRILSTIASTASMDKAPQSKSRGITLDLGFSSFRSSAPEHFQEKGISEIQFCLVDCPGHASLIKTVIGGAQIIDVCCLVVDAIKGVQTQTAECIVVAELLVSQLIVIVNKLDTVQANTPEEKEKKIQATVSKLRKLFAKTKFGHDLPIACVAAHPSNGEEPVGIENLVNVIKSNIKVPTRDDKGPLCFSFDHCFQLKGQGTILTGTVVAGTAKVGQVVDLPALGDAGAQKKIRSIQIFKQPVQKAIQGDRCALCVPALDAKELERGLVTDGMEPTPKFSAAIIVCERISYFKSPVNTNAKFHISVGHQTVVATAQFFCPLPTATRQNGEGAIASDGATLCMSSGALVDAKDQLWPKTFNFDGTYSHLNELFPSRTYVEYPTIGGDAVRLAVGPKAPKGLELLINGVFIREVTSMRQKNGILSDDQGAFGGSKDSDAAIALPERSRTLYQLQWLTHSRNVSGLDPPVDKEPICYARLQFEKPVICPPHSLLIGSKLDFDAHAPNCRLAFFGRILTSVRADLGSKVINVIKMKQKTGVLERVDKHDQRIYVCKDLFNAETDIETFLGLKVIHQKTGIMGVIESTFGQGGKVKINFEKELNINCDSKGHVRGKQEVILYFKKYSFDSKRKFTQ